MKKITSFFVLLTFILSCVMPPQGFAQTLSAVGLMPEPGVAVGLTAAFTPAHLKGMVIHPNDPFKFDFIIYKGDVALNSEETQAEYQKLIKYFLASLAVPDTDQWVNLSPYEQDRIIPDTFGLTEMGRDLLAQDYLLKQISASLTNPDTDLGKQFWDSVYEQAFQKFGTTEIPTDTFNKVWVVPDSASIYEKDNAVYVVDMHLKVMMEKDYLATKENQADVSPQEENDTTQISRQVMREVIIPAIEKEVNEGQSFAPVRQVYSGALLAAWYKRALKDSILNQVYGDKSKVKGIDQDPAKNQEIYNQYVTAFKKGVFNMIKDDVDRLTQEVIPRKYFSGGFLDAAMVFKNNQVTRVPVAAARRNVQEKGPSGFVSVGTQLKNSPAAMTAKQNQVMKIEDLTNFILKLIETNSQARNADLTKEQIKELRARFKNAGLNLGNKALGELVNGIEYRLRRISLDPQWKIVSNKMDEARSMLTRNISNLAWGNKKRAVGQVPVSLFGDREGWGTIPQIVTLRIKEIPDGKHAVVGKIVVRVGNSDYLLRMNDTNDIELVSPQGRVVATASIRWSMWSTLSVNGRPMIEVSSDPESDGERIFVRGAPERIGKGETNLTIRKADAAMTTLGEIRTPQFEGVVARIIYQVGTIKRTLEDLQRMGEFSQKGESPQNWNGPEVIGRLENFIGQLSQDERSAEEVSQQIQDFLDNQVRSVEQDFLPVGGKVEPHSLLGNGLGRQVAGLRESLGAMKKTLDLAVEQKQKEQRRTLAFFMQFVPTYARQVMGEKAWMNPRQVREELFRLDSEVLGRNYFRSEDFRKVLQVAEERIPPSVMKNILPKNDLRVFYTVGGDVRMNVFTAPEVLAKLKARKELKMSWLVAVAGLLAARINRAVNRYRPLTVTREEIFTPDRAKGETGEQRSRLVLSNGKTLDTKAADRITAGTSAFLANLRKEAPWQDNEEFLTRALAILASVAGGIPTDYLASYLVRGDESGNYYLNLATWPQIRQGENVWVQVPADLLENIRSERMEMSVTRKFVRPEVAVVVRTLQVDMQSPERLASSHRSPSGEPQLMSNDYNAMLNLKDIQAQFMNEGAPRIPGRDENVSLIGDLNAIEKEYLPFLNGRETKSVQSLRDLMVEWKTAEKESLDETKTATEVEQIKERMRNIQKAAGSVDFDFAMTAEERNRMSGHLIRAAEVMQGLKEPNLQTRLPLPFRTFAANMYAELVGADDSVRGGLSATSSQEMLRADVTKIIGLMTAEVKRVESSKGTAGGEGQVSKEAIGQVNEAIRELEALLKALDAAMTITQPGNGLGKWVGWNIFGLQKPKRLPMDIVLQNGYLRPALRPQQPTPVPAGVRYGRQTRGGIDLNTATLDMQIKRDGSGVPLPISQQNLENIRIDGLVPVILEIRPAASLPLFAEMQASAGGSSV